MSVEMGKRELNFQIDYNLGSGVQYIDYFGKIRPNFDNFCGVLVQILVKQNASKIILKNVFVKNLWLINQVQAPWDMTKKKWSF